MTATARDVQSVTQGAVPDKIDSASTTASPLGVRKAAPAHP